MPYPTDLKYTKDHEWIRISGDIAEIGITDFAQGELVMVSAFVSLTLLGTGLPYVVVVPLGILFGAVLGTLV